MPRLFFNKAIVYEDQARQYPNNPDTTETYGEAYKYYKMTYIIFRELVGENHARTVRYLHTLREPTYQWFADNRHEDVTELGMDHVKKLLDGPVGDEDPQQHPAG